MQYYSRDRIQSKDLTWGCALWSNDVSFYISCMYGRLSAVDLASDPTIDDYLSMTTLHPRRSSLSKLSISLVLSLANRFRRCPYSFEISKIYIIPSHNKTPSKKSVGLTPSTISHLSSLYFFISHKKLTPKLSHISTVLIKYNFFDNKV